MLINAYKCSKMLLKMVIQWSEFDLFSDIVQVDIRVFTLMGRAA